MKQKHPIQKKVTITLMLLALIVLSFYGLLFAQEFIGHVTNSHQGLAGNIYSLVIRYTVPVSDWTGMYGVAVRVEGFDNQQFETLTGGSTNEANLLFDCLERDIPNEVYASTAGPGQIDFNTITSATPAEVDAFLGKNPTDFDSATNTFTEVASVTIGANTVVAPAVYTYRVNESAPQTFSTALLKDGNNNLIFASTLTDFIQGFNGRIYNYQLLLPAPQPDGHTYYFYTDPNDVCPEGEGEALPKGSVIGNVTDTSGIRLEGVIIDVAGANAVTNNEGYYNLTTSIGQYFIYAIKQGYEVYISNITVVQNETVVHDIILEERQEPDPSIGDGVSDGVGPGVDVPGDSTLTGTSDGEGPGQVPPVPFTEQPIQIEGTDYIVSLNDLKRKVRVNEFLQERIRIFSFRQTSTTLTFEINGTAAQLIDLDKDTLFLDPNDNGEITLTIFGRAEPGFYNGTLYMDGDFNATIPIEIEVVARDRLPVEALHLQLETARTQLLPGHGLRFKTDLRNLLIEHPYSVELYYTIQKVDGGPVVWSDTSNTYLRTAFSIIKTAELPDNLDAGDYILRVTARYLGLTSSSSALFTVDVPLWQRLFLGLRYWHWALILGAIAAIAGAGYWYYRTQQAKKKFHIKVDRAELPPPGPRNIYMGKIAETDHKTYFNLEQFKVHTIVAGSTGGGKSVSAQVAIEEALEKGVAVIAFDPTAQWTGMLRPCKDKMMLSLYPLFGMKKTDARGYPGNVRMILDPREKININDYVKPGEIQVFCFHKLNPKDMDTVVANAIRSIFESGPQENKALKVLFVFDEVHRLLPKFGGSGDGFLQIERACREFRKWGLGVMLISQVLSDFVGTIKANINTEIQMRTRDEGDLERIRQKYGEDVLRSLVKATVGSGMVENPAYNRGQPYFVAFKPLKHSVERMTDEEIQQYNDYNDKMDNLFFSLDQLEKEGVDVFDLKLELKLAMDKVKAGNFNMVDVYLEGLTPRIDKEWDKLGKKPKQFERELVNEADLKADLEKAKAEREKAQAAEGGGEEKKEEKKDMGWKDDVPPENILSLTNGMIVISLSSLYDEVKAMKEEDFGQHVVPEEKNDFAEWVMNAIKDTKLAYNLYATTTQDKFIEMLEMKRDEKELPDAKPPAWLANKGASAAPQEKPAENKEENKEVRAEEKKEEASTQEQSTEQSPAETPAQAATQEPTKEEQATQQPAQADAQTQPAEQPAEQSAPAEQLATVEKTVEQAQPTPEQTPAEEPAETTEQKNPTPEEIAKSEEESFKEYAKEPAENKPSNLEMMVTSPDKAFKLENGTCITSVKELKDYLQDMSDGLFNNHVGQDYNHFADWVQGVFHEEQLAQKMRQAHTKDELVAKLS